MMLLPPRSTLYDSLFPDTTLFRSISELLGAPRSFWAAVRASDARLRLISQMQAPTSLLSPEERKQSTALLRMSGGKASKRSAFLPTFSTSKAIRKFRIRPWLNSRHPISRFTTLTRHRSEARRVGKDGFLTFCTRLVPYY